MVVIAVIGPWLDRYSANGQNLTAAFQSPSWHHWFGTDEFGRDVFARVVAATHVDLQIGLFGVTLPLTLGTMIGLCAGYRGGWLDAAVGRVIDVFQAFPFFVLVIAVVAMLGPGVRNLYIAFTGVGWVAYARIIRGEALSVKQREYIAAARGLGYSTPRILARHLLPNVLAPAIVFAMSDFVLCIVVGASVSFFGLGVQPPQAEWGSMIADGQSFIFNAPWIMIFPGAAIVVVGFFFSLLGDGVADYLRHLDEAV